MVSQPGQIEQSFKDNVGVTFANRTELYKSGLHRALRAGIVGTAVTGAESVVLSGGYEDEDYGDEIIYTGHGGRDPNTGKQVADQSPESYGNAALIASCLSGASVRVIRGPNPHSPHAPTSGYRYDGLFRVESYWMEPGASGYLACRYHLVSQEFYAPVLEVDAAKDDSPALQGNHQPGRRLAMVQRIIRSTAVADHVKVLYNFTCQICRTRLPVGTKVGYAEGAHIHPLGRPHHGPDVIHNVLCLCPNCHVLFDHGAIGIGDDLVIHGGPNDGYELLIQKSHKIDVVYVGYHRKIHAIVVPHP